MVSGSAWSAFDSNDPGSARASRPARLSAGSQAALPAPDLGCVAAGSHRAGLVEERLCGSCLLRHRLSLGRGLGALAHGGPPCAPELEGRDIAVVGVVASLPAIGERALRFEFEVESAPGGEKLPGKLLVSWYRASAWEEAPAVLASAVHPGERWLLTLRLRRPHGLVNPHGFDYEAWLLERGVGATGYVRSRARTAKDRRKKLLFGPD